MGRNIGKNISKNLSSKYSQKCIDHAKQMHLKLIKKVRWKTAEATRDFVGKEFADKVTRTSETSPKKKWIWNNWNKWIKKMRRERFTPPELRHEIIDNIRLKINKINEINKIN